MRFFLKWEHSYASLQQHLESGVYMLKGFIVVALMGLYEV